MREFALLQNEMKWNEAISYYLLNRLLCASQRRLKKCHGKSISKKSSKFLNNDVFDYW